MPLAYTHLESPVGPLLLAGDDRGLRVLAFTSGNRSLHPTAHNARGGDPGVRVDPSWTLDESRVLRGVADELEAYFGGRLRAFRTPVAPRGTPFQLRVWEALREIPYGETVSYGELSRRIGRPEAVRAVGAANGANPIAIIIPCHRVIGANGSLTGFGGGLDVKRALLALERGEARLPILER
jgi:methylated-DNA-[protein]-cysteine S-methyltransferase